MRPMHPRPIGPSRTRPGPPPAPDPRIFAALGDATRLGLLERLHGASTLSIRTLAEGTAMTRQAVTKHLEILAQAGLVRDVRAGRERRFALDGAPLGQIAVWLESYRASWEERLDRLEADLREVPPDPDDAADATGRKGQTTTTSKALKGMP